MRKILHLVMLLCLWLPHLASGQRSNDKRFPFMAWDYVEDPRILQSMHEAGITSVAFVRPKTLNDCQKYNLKCIVFDERLSGDLWSKPFNGDLFRKNLSSIIKEVGNHPALWGYHVKDEPPESDFPELAKAVAGVNELAPGKWPYINLFPGEGDSYDKYLDHFVDIVHPAALSYDRYSIIGEPGSGGLDPIFWENLAQVRDAAQRHHLPFWNIVLSSPHWRYRDLTEADIRLQVWASLAYGVRGISYYKFVSKELPILNADDLGNWRGGPLNQFEEKTPTWDWLRDTDRQVQNIAPVYLQLRTDDVYHLGDIPKLNHGPSEQSLIKSMPEGEYVVGEFTHPTGDRYVLIVNKSLKRSAHCDPKFNVPPAEVQYVFPRTGETKPFPTRWYWLAPGQGVLLRLVAKNSAGKTSILTIFGAEFRQVPLGFANYEISTHESRLPF